MTRTRLALMILGSAAAVLAQPAIAPPSAGMVRDSSGSVQAVNGIAGNFVLADLGIPNAVSAAFSGSAGLVKTDTELLVLNASFRVTARYDSSPGPALFAFDAAGAPALAYLAGALYRFNNGNLEALNWSGNVLAVGVAGPQSASLLVGRDDGIWTVRLSLPAGDLENEALLAGVSGPAALLQDGSVVYVDGNDVVVRDGVGAERRAAAGIVAGYVERMGRDWVAIREAGAGRLFAMRIREQGLELYQVPEVSE